MSSLNYNYRLQQLHKIDMENQRIIERLNSPSGTISMKSLHQEWENMMKLKKMISRAERADPAKIKKQNQSSLKKNFSGFISSDSKPDIQSYV
jgi:hypothetical protein